MLRSAAASVEALPKPVSETVFREEVELWARRINVEPAQVQLRPMKNKWASCSAKGKLTFDPALLEQPAAFRAEVIVHELLHLRIPNHGRLFKLLVRSYLDKYGIEKNVAVQGTQRRWNIQREPNHRS
ncbi:MAG: M48 family metallopeptidase [Moorella sp. (in: Bacteria)]|nr:M48 family metallopeptidase [Moorella sp. (in: firmicutes)]